MHRCSRLSCMHATRMDASTGLQQATLGAHVLGCPLTCLAPVFPPAQVRAAACGRILISPYEDRYAIAGQGTVGYEILRWPPLPC
jgi:hypothetical protein